MQYYLAYLTLGFAHDLRGDSAQAQASECRILHVLRRLQDVWDDELVEFASCNQTIFVEISRPPQGHPGAHQ